MRITQFCQQIIKEKILAQTYLIHSKYSIFDCCKFIIFNPYFELLSIIIQSFILNSNWNYYFLKMKRQATKGMVLYEQVLQKNFQIIETFLNKFPIIFKKQDFFEESIKRINEKLNKHDNQNEKIREELLLNCSVLDKKITNVKQNTNRSHRNSSKFSQDIIQSEDKKNSIFKIAGFKEQIQSNSNYSYMSKEKHQQILQLQRKHLECSKKVEELENNIERLSQKFNFLSIFSSKTESTVDLLVGEKVGKPEFDKLAKQYNQKFAILIYKLIQEKQEIKSALMNKKMSQIQTSLNLSLQNMALEIKKQLLIQIEKKTNITQFRSQVTYVKQVIEKVVSESVDSFASKEETKSAFILFEKKCLKLEMVLEQLLNQTIKPGPEEQGVHCLTLPGRRQREVMNNFGRKKRVIIDRGIPL